MTERLFWQDAYLREFDAKVDSVDENGVRLDRTAFNPRGGGLVSDVGKLNGADVTEVIKKDEEIYHVLGGGVSLRPGEAVRGVIDWENSRPDGLPTRDLARFVIAYSLYLDRHTRPGRRVSGHRGLVAGEWGAGVEYAIKGTGWYPELAQRFVSDGLQRLGVPSDRCRDVMLAEIACIAADADHPDFAWNHLLLLRRLSREAEQ